MASNAESQDDVPAVEDISLDDHEDAPVVVEAAPKSSSTEDAAPSITKTPSPASTMPSQVSGDAGFTPLVSVVGFHHARGPEVESWFGADEGVDPAAEYGWGLLSFMALSDGAHA